MNDVSLMNDSVFSMNPVFPSLKIRSLSSSVLPQTLQHGTAEVNWQFDSGGAFSTVIGSDTRDRSSTSIIPFLGIFSMSEEPVLLGNIAHHPFQRHRKLAEARSISL